MMSTVTDGIHLIGDVHSSRALQMVQSPLQVRFLVRCVAVCFVASPVGVLWVPWQQNLPGWGKVVAFAPLDRPQNVDAPIDGRIVRWWVQEGSVVQAGDPLVEISDVDPNLVDRLQQERSAVQGKLEAYEQKALSYEQQIVNLESTRDLAVAAATFYVETGKQKVLAAQAALEAAEVTRRVAGFQFERCKRLLDDGIVSQRDFELAERDLEVARTAHDSAEAALLAANNEFQALEANARKTRVDAESKVDSARAALSEARGQAQDARMSLAKIEVSLSRQESRRVVAPRAGTVFRLLVAEGGALVKTGQPMLSLVPEAQDRAVELWVSGNDAPLIAEGSPVRLQFEGWPAVQFVGWPSVAVGTFGGEVTLIDMTDDGSGRFRMLVSPDPDDAPWPEMRYLRQGVRAKGWVLLNRVTIGYEVWRQLNGFPPIVNQDEPVRDVARKRLK